ncbi:hypothetical protein Poras_0009 [Porphyromonas asaccharolytica DSM 20707]|uniref:Uncharacterized protein n=1 Tax=Porphyromonas asaccharolytica (strain ATCC 25260 / DSM 20707 / BCRC 10618 / CCUG 7834 / JCM 6326 / LMG 13178 / VPI 4198 / B440) TaxID=879243 RepID=F4KKT0_PORAD|nr:hypothetical protein Poras_0009 [Porphyromonas asaccharolytica DSM 20707]
MQVKSEVFSRFASSVDFSSGEPLGGVEAPTVGADLCVRPSSPERSLFCGRTRRSAPTQATSARQFYSSNAVTPISVGADLCVRPSSPECSLFCGRTRRSAPTQATSARLFYSSNAVTPISVGTDLCVRPSSPECSLFCGRTRRSAPTRITPTRRIIAVGRRGKAPNDPRMLDSARSIAPLRV